MISRRPNYTTTSSRRLGCPVWERSLLQALACPTVSVGDHFDSPRLLTYSTAGTHSLDQALVLFGRPKSVTGFFRVQRDAESEVEDTFTIILQYDGAQKDLLVTVKTAVVTPMDQQLKQLVRGTKGSFIKVLSLPSAQSLMLTIAPVPTAQHMHNRGPHCRRSEAHRRRVWRRI